ncbi:MAG: aminotransferase class I/II-fold pyridoxal phosphate-dependent enzyme [Nanoarchaeota archaeon]
MIPRYIPELPKSSMRLFLNLIYKGKFIEGNYINKFEEEFANRLGIDHAILFSSARNGLISLLRQLKIGKGDEVIVPSYTCPAVPSVIEKIGATPIFIDVEKDTFNIDTKLIKSKITKKTKAIIATHIDGQPCDLKEIIGLASSYNLKLIEDCAQAIDAKYKGIKVGRFGDAAYYSFAFGKQLNTLGGGMIVTNNNLIATNLRRDIKKLSLAHKLPIINKYILMYFINFCLNPFIFKIFISPLIHILNIVGIDPINILFKDQGQVRKFTKYTNFQAGLGLQQLKQLDENNAKRIKNARTLSKLLSKNIKIQKQIKERESIFLYYSVLLDRRKKTKRKLIRLGIDTQESWNVSCSRLNRFRKYNCVCPVSDQLEKKALYLPIYSQLKKKGFNLYCKTTK